MAYLKKLDKPCQKCGIRRAVVELITNRNAVMGRYCQPCGSRRLAEQQAIERR